MDNHLHARLADDRVEFTLTESAHTLHGQLLDKASGRLWGPVPLLAMEVYDKPVRRIERFERYTIEGVTSSAHTVQVVVSAPGTGVTVGLSLRVAAGELVARLSPAEVYELEDDRRRLFMLDLLPGLLTVAGANSRLLLPVNGATLCCPANKPAVRDQFLIYLEQPRWELATMLPIVAAWDEHGGVLGLATLAAAEAQCRVATDGRGAGAVGFAFSLRQLWPDPVEPGIRELRLIPLPVGADPVVSVAKRLRRHVVTDLGKPTLAARAAASPAVAYMLNAMTIKLFHGIQNEGACIGDKRGLPPSHFHTAMTFAEAEHCLRHLHAAGLPRLYTQCVGWNARGHDGLYPTRFPVEERLGGEAGLRALFATGHALGYQMNVHDNYQMNVPQAPDWDTDCIIQDPYGEPLVRGWWGGGTEYASWPAALPERRVGGHFARLQALGVQGMHYCDYWFPPLEVNYHPRWRGSRTQHQLGVEAVLAAARHHFGAVSTEFGPLPAAVACDSLAMQLPHGYLHACRQHPEWPVTALLDQSAPVYGLALHGLVAHQASGGPTWHNLMNSVLWGALPRDEWGVHPIPMGGIHVFDARRGAGLVALHELGVARYGYLAQVELLTATEPAPQVHHHTFADGTSVTADFKTMTLLVNGQPVPRDPRLL